MKRFLILILNIIGIVVLLLLLLPAHINPVRIYKIMNNNFDLALLEELGFKRYQCDFNKPYQFPTDNPKFTCYSSPDFDNTRKKKIENIRIDQILKSKGWDFVGSGNNTYELEKENLYIHLDAFSSSSVKIIQYYDYYGYYYGDENF